MRPSLSVGPPGVIDTTTIAVCPSASFFPTRESPKLPSGVFSISVLISFWVEVGADFRTGGTRTSLSVEVFDDKVESVS